MSIFLSRAVLSLATACALSPVAAQSPVPPSEACRAVQVAARQAPVSVPFALVDGRVYVEARVNGGGPYRFAVDTGASGIGRADARLVSGLGLSPRALWPTPMACGPPGARPCDWTRWRLADWHGATWR